MTASIAIGPTALGRIPVKEIHGSFIDETIGVLANAPASTISFAVGAPAREALGLVGIANLVERVLARDGYGALGYGVTEGDAELRDTTLKCIHTRLLQSADSSPLWDPPQALPRLW